MADLNTDLIRDKVLDSLKESLDEDLISVKEFYMAERDLLDCLEQIFGYMNEYPVVEEEEYDE